jgi:hypothetical protein
MAERLKYWMVNYGDAESHEVAVPHAWRLDADVRSEGPVVYKYTIQVPREPMVLSFEGVSYEAVVSIDGTEVLTHRGIWDAFEVPLDAYKGRKVEVQVVVTKNGGERFPVKDVASGFLPYVYHTFGGIWGEVWLKESAQATNDQRPSTRLLVDNSRLYLDGEPFYIRGLLHWGWYPELGHHNAPEDVIRREVQGAKAMGFNLVKFCLWVPPHRYLDILQEEGMEAWLELPLWDPSSDPEKLEEIGQEIERIVRQYRHHDNIIVWTVGCELSHATPPEYRQYMVNLVKNLTGSPMVKDNSGGAEMYGGDLREFGDFFDYHPYCDTQFYPLVLDSLLPGPRPTDPILLGEFNDIDVHRDLERLHDEMPYWASAMPELNDQGVRWQHDVPKFIRHSALATGDEHIRHERLMESSRRKSLFIRKTVQEWVRSRDPIAGYVITGWRDTPISTAGFFDDWDRPRFQPEETIDWNGPDVLFLIPTRRPPWVDGGNRPGWLDPYNHFVGQVFFRVGIHSESGAEGGLSWKIVDEAGKTIVRGAEPQVMVDDLKSTEIAQIPWSCETPGAYELHVEFGGTKNAWKFYVEAKPEFPDWRLSDPRRLFGAVKFGEGPNQVFVDHVEGLSSLLDEGGQAVVFLNTIGTNPMPFWREAAYDFAANAPFTEEWERLLAVSGDSALDPAILAEILPTGANTEILINRVDVRTYAEAPVMIRVSHPKGKAILTSLRPHGGLGVQPNGLARNPAGCALIRLMLDLLK